MVRPVIDGCAVIVTFHPASDVLANLSLLRSRIATIVVVDNGSSARELDPLRVASEATGFLLIENGDNLGIATALNVGIRRAMELGARWVMLFDQDSCITDDFVSAMVTEFDSGRWGERLGILVPRYVDRRLGTALKANEVRQGLEAAMTSGSMMRTKIFARCGFFLDELFIDGVDYEFSLRLRQRGYVIDECSEAVLLHSPGEPRRHSLFGLFRYQTANYSPVRRYYQERNKVWIAKRYALRFPVFCFKLFFFSVKDFVKIVIAEEGRWVKVRYFLRGVMDGVRGRMGRLKGA